jgi:hypothetical protein
LDAARDDYPVPDDLDDPRFRWLFNYWRDRHRGDLLPSREQIDPTDFPQLLGRIHLIDVIRSGSAVRYRVRLWGSMIRHVFNKDVTGRWLDETLVPGTTADVELALANCVAGHPHFWRRPMMPRNQEFIATRRLLLPLASDGRTVDILLGLIIEDVDEEW